MVKRNQLLSAQIGAAIRAFRSETCPWCNGEKAEVTDPFCDECLLRLPLSYRHGFCDRSNFIDLYHSALAHLQEQNASGM